jgi:hypothetical protein
MGAHVQGSNDVHHGLSEIGKRTKAMQAQLNSWDPASYLERATNDECVSWHRSYIIKWLYDLIPVFSSVVVQRNTMKGEGHVYKDIE